MRFASAVLLLAVPVTVYACEGDCITGVANAFVSNYTKPVNSTIWSIANQIQAEILPHYSPLKIILDLLSPIIDGYHREAYAHMEKAIFPSYFHGKCLDDNNVEPEGCPNPDCPIVCGTPGSLVHFYPKLRYIAFNATYHTLESFTTPGSPAYNEVERRVLDAFDASSHKQRRTVASSRIFPRGFLEGFNIAQHNAPAPSSAVSAPPGSAPPAGSALASESSPPTSGSGPSASSLSSGMRSGLLKASPGSSPLAPLTSLLKRTTTEQVKEGLKSIVIQVQSIMAETCGAEGAGRTNGLPLCSWEDVMKPYILSFP